MSIEVGRIYGFILIPLVIGFLYFTSKKMKESKVQDKFPLISRILIFILLIGAFSDITLTFSGKNVATIFLLDVSDSAKNFKEEGISFINNSLKNMPKKNKAGIIVFGENAEIDKFIDRNKEYSSIKSMPIVNSTNIQEAIQSAVSLFPNGASKRIVLITDGEENQGDMIKTLPLIEEENIDIKTYKIDNGEYEDVYVEEVKVPENINIGEEFSIISKIQSNVKTKATLTLFSGREKKGEQIVDIEKGKNTFVFKDIQISGGFKGYKVLIKPEIDTQVANNEYTCYTNVRAKPQILIVEGKKDEAAGIMNALKSVNGDYKVISPMAVPSNLNDFLEYKTIVLSNVNIDDLTKGFIDNIETYVKDYGGGLITTGGEDSYALGGYKNTVLEKILPVDMDKKGKNEIPQISLSLVIDKSGSMAGENNNVSKLTLAKEAAIKALDNLRFIDEIGVIAFDDSFGWAVERQPLKDKDKIKEDISRIALKGGTSIYPALEAAYNDQLESGAKIKHIILLTDGQDGFSKSEYSDLIEEMKEKNITLSTVSVGTDANNDLLEYLAEESKGRSYHTDIYTDIPRIFAKEVLLSTGVYLMNGEFTPILKSSHEILDGVIVDGKIPSLLGYIGTSIKEKAIEVLSSHENEPVLALWQYGIGRVISWTSDVSGQWSGNLLSSSKGGQLFKNIIDWSVPSYDNGGKISITQDGGNAIVEFETKNIDENKNIKGMYSSENGEEGELNLEQVEPGKYRGSVNLNDLGFYNFNVKEEVNGEIIGSYNGAFALQYSPEYKFNFNKEKLDALVEESGGSFIKLPEDVFTGESKKSYKHFNLTILLLVSALFLFFFDVVYRRFNLNFKKFIMRFNFIKSLKDKLKKEEKNNFSKLNENYKEKKDSDTYNKSLNNSTTKNKKEDEIVESKKNKVFTKKNNEKKHNKKDKKNESNRLDTTSLLKKKQDRNGK